MFNISTNTMNYESTHIDDGSIDDSVKKNVNNFAYYATKYKTRFTKLYYDCLRAKICQKNLL